MTRVTRKQIAARFREATYHLWDGKDWQCPLDKEQFICIALDEAANLYGDILATLRCQEIIQQRLGRDVESLEDWIFRYHGSCIEDLRYNCTAREKMQTTRLAWLDSLIKEFSKR